MVFIMTERLIWNGKGAPVSLNEKWGLGKEGFMLSSTQGITCIFGGKKGKVYTHATLLRLVKKLVHCMQ